MGFGLSGVMPSGVLSVYHLYNVYAICVSSMHFDNLFCDLGYPGFPEISAFWESGSKICINHNTTNDTS